MLYEKIVHLCRDGFEFFVVSLRVVPLWEFVCSDVVGGFPFVHRKRVLTVRESLKNNNGIIHHVFIKDGLICIIGSRNCSFFINIKQFFLSNQSLVTEEPIKGNFLGNFLTIFGRYARQCMALYAVAPKWGGVGPYRHHWSTCTYFAKCKKKVKFFRKTWGVHPKTRVCGLIGRKL